MPEPEPVNCDYGPAGEVATRYGEDGAPLCVAHCREHYGADWRVATRKLTSRVAARFALSGSCLY